MKQELVLYLKMDKTTSESPLNAAMVVLSTSLQKTGIIYTLLVLIHLTMLLTLRHD